MNAETFCRDVCQRASGIGFRLQLEPTDHGFRWAWETRGAIISTGGTTAETKPVALFFACQDIAPALGHFHAP